MTKYTYNTEEVSSIHKTDSITDNITIIIFYSYNIDQDMGVETFPGVVIGNPKVDKGNT